MMQTNATHQIYSDSEMANRIRSFDWSATALGPLNHWPLGLQFHLNRILEAGFPTVLWWGGHHIQFCNDACFRLQQNNQIFENVDRLGTPSQKACPALWTLVEKNIGKVMATGKPIYLENEWVNNVSHTNQDFYWTCSFDPIRDEHGTIAGIAATFKEASIIYRRLQRKEQDQSFLLELTDRLRVWGQEEDTAKAVLNMIGKYLDVDRLGLAELIEDSGKLLVRYTYEKENIVPMKGFHHLEKYGYDLLSVFNSGQCVIKHDIMADEGLDSEVIEAYQKIQTGAMIDIPLLKSGRLNAVLFAHHQHPHAWTEEELSILKQSAERIWDALTLARAEEHVIRSEEQYRTLFHSLDEAFMVIDFIFDEQGNPINYTFIQVNSAFEAQSGLRKVVGKTILEIMPDIEPAWIQKYSSVAITRQPLRFEEYNEGTCGWYDVYAVAMEKSSSQVIVVFKDITERKLEDQRKDDFLSIASHELKTPLTSLGGYMFMLRNMLQKDANPKPLEVVERASKQITKMTSLINSFLNISQLNAGKMTLKYEYFNLPDLLHEVKEDIIHRIQSYRVEFENPHELHIYADQHKICQVIENLLTNSIKYSPPGSLVHLSCEQQHDQVLISVQDEGRGLQPDELSKVFQRFYRADTQHSETISGFGIGLYLCKEIIEQHGGQIGVESTPGQGSRFWFSLPLLTQTPA